MTNTLKKNTSLCDILNIKYPIIMAPMFLVSNIEMLVAASKSGITGAIPALNFRTIEEFEIALKELKEKPNLYNMTEEDIEEEMEKLV